MTLFRRLMIAPLAIGVLAGSAAGAFAGDSYFSRVATLPVYTTLAKGVDPATETVAEIVTATKDGMTLVHTDSPGEALVFIDIADPAAPKGLGRTALGGEPTSVTVVGGYALAAVNTSRSFTQPSGHVAVVDIATRRIVARCDVGGQPDAVAASPDGRYLAVAVENERDEKLNDGALPQLPPGHLSILDLGTDGMPANCAAARTVAMTGLAAIAPEDPEPEFVSVNSRNVAVVTLQENNHIVLVDLTTGAIVTHFPAGTVSLSGIPTDKKKRVDGTGSLSDVPREPDAVVWIDDNRFVTANEGDWKGGSRGFTVWNAKGHVLHDSGADMEHLGMAHGHYPAKRASKKGVEPEGVAFGVYGGAPLLFVNSERGNFVAVYKDKGAASTPEFVQFLPTGVGPEGLLAIPQRDLFVVATEADSAEDGVRATVGIYQRGAALPSYPTLVSQTDPATGAPIGWGAQSGLVADRTDANRFHSVSDSFYDTARIFTIDASGAPARIVSYVDLKGGKQKSYDLEGIAHNSRGGFWVVSEGNPEKEMANLLLWVDADGTVAKEIPLPESIAAAATRFGFEGVAEYKDGDTVKVIVAVQREWKDDPKGMVKLAIYTPAKDHWTFVHYPLEKPAAGAWVGLSEITHLGGNDFAVLERDNQGGPKAALKAVYRISLDGITPAEAGQPLPVVKKTRMLDLLPHLTAGNGWTADKPEGFAVTVDGQMVAVTDNDGVDDATGETLFLRLGPVGAVVTN
ncbi:esterase-like activity of phytase family protein [Caenispirillum bisanense]|uniref:esterase-like activity of phytase family protein n=1 Tax=Caenispirillum bisanense TaxID=414052 RepID=UPI0031DE6AB7